MRLVVAVFSAPGNSLARATIRKTWARKLQEFPGVKLVFMLGRHADSTQHVSWRRKISDDVRKNILLIWKNILYSGFSNEGG